MIASKVRVASERTSVSVTKGISQPNGGTILHIPYVLAFSDIDLI